MWDYTQFHLISVFSVQTTWCVRLYFKLLLLASEITKVDKILVDSDGSGFRPRENSFALFLKIHILKRQNSDYSEFRYSIQILALKMSEFILFKTIFLIPFFIY